MVAKLMRCVSVVRRRHTQTRSSTLPYPHNHYTSNKEDVNDYLTDTLLGEYTMKSEQSRNNPTYNPKASRKDGKNASLPDMWACNLAGRQSLYSPSSFKASNRGTIWWACASHDTLDMFSLWQYSPDEFARPWIQHRGIKVYGANCRCLKLSKMRQSNLQLLCLLTQEMCKLSSMGEIYTCIN